MRGLRRAKFLQSTRLGDRNSGIRTLAAVLREVRRADELAVREPPCRHRSRASTRTAPETRAADDEIATGHMGQQARL